MAAVGEGAAGAGAPAAVFDLLADPAARSRPSLAVRARGASHAYSFVGAPARHGRSGACAGAVRGLPQRRLQALQTTAAACGALHPSGRVVAHPGSVTGYLVDQVRDFIMA